jgi:glutathione S-transferase
MQSFGPKNGCARDFGYRISTCLALFVAEGGMTLYVKAGPDGSSLGDCPFAHFVRMVLEVKGLDYELKPSVQGTKPTWLIEHYEGKMPALRHRKECYVESDTIAAYLDFFFPQPELSPPNTNDAKAAEAAVEGLFPAIAQYIKHTPDGDETDEVKKSNLKSVLERLNAHLSTDSRAGPYLVGDGSVIRMADCKLAPMLYHMCTAVASFKGDKAIDLPNEFPAVHAYTTNMFETESAFLKTVYPREVVTWGWGNARGK